MRYTARVVPGRGEGRTLGFPTLNVEIPPGLAAKHGVYAGWAWVNGEALPAALHYGPVPVFKSQAPTLEVYVDGHGHPRTPAELSFEMVEYIREIKDFPDVEALKEQIREDVEKAREILKKV